MFKGCIWSKSEFLTIILLACMVTMYETPYISSKMQNHRSAKIEYTELLLNC